MNPLQRSPEEYREVFLRISELAANLLAELNHRPSFPNLTGNESQRRFVQPLPEQGMGFVPSSVALNETQLDALNLKIMNYVQRAGRIYISNATIHGRFCLRACVVNHRSTQQMSKPSSTR